MKLGIVFSGQGAQYPGMGLDLYENSEAARAVFDDAGTEVRGWCFHGTAEELKQTRITQPAIYTVTMAAYEAFLEAAGDAGIEMDIIGYAGFSLGEYAALTASGAIDEIGKGLKIVQDRGVFMQAAGQDEAGENMSGMAAAFGKRAEIEDAVEEAKQGRVLEAVNFNSPIQTVVAGENAALDTFVEVAKARKIKAKRLPVSTAFHCALMKPAAEKLLPVLQGADMKLPKKKIYSDATAEDIMAGFTGDAGDDKAVAEYLAEVMAKQAMSPVYWQEIVENMVKDGAETIIEIGPGKTLSGLIKKITKEAVPMHVEDKKSLDETISALAEKARG
jgi:[acyl-carrier-protein] S-malonyltransferase